MAALVGLCLILVACEVATIQRPTLTLRLGHDFLPGFVNFGFYVFGIFMAPIFVCKKFDRWWTNVDWWQAFLAPILFGLARAAINSLHAPTTGLTAICLAYGIGFVSNPKVLKRFKKVMKGLPFVMKGENK